MNTGYSNIIHIDKKPKTDILSTDQGWPIWPIRTNRELAALHDVSQVFNGTLISTNGNVNFAARPSKELVVAIGTELAQEAELYAHLTGRRSIVIENIKKIVELENISIVICKQEEITGDNLSLLYGSSKQSSAPGIVAAQSRQELRQQILVRAAALKLHTIADRPMVEYLPNTSINIEIIGRRFYIGNAAEINTRRGILSMNSPLLHIASHSDGVDGHLGDGLVVCPAMNSLPFRSRSRVPRCIASGKCHRTNFKLSQLRSGVYIDESDLFDVEKAKMSGKLVSPDSFRTRVLAWNVCWGILDYGAPVDPTWGVGYGFANSSSIGALITTWQPDYQNNRHIQVLLEQIGSGNSLGASLQLLNTSDSQKVLGNLFCLFGDPALRIPQNEQRENKASKSINIRPHQEKANRINSRRQNRRARISTGYDNLLSLYFNQLEPQLIGNTKKLAVSAQLHFRQYTESYRTGVNESMGSKARAAALDFFVNYEGTLIENYQQFAKTYADKRMLSDCFVCGQKTNVLRISFVDDGILSRRLRTCPRCGVIEDAPVKSNIIMPKIENNIVRIIGSLPTKYWAASLVLDSSLASDRRHTIWPKDELTHKPVRELNISDLWPMGPTGVTFILMHKTDLTLIGQYTCRAN